LNGNQLEDGWNGEASADPLQPPAEDQSTLTCSGVWNDEVQAVESVMASCDLFNQTPPLTGFFQWFFPVSKDSFLFYAPMQGRDCGPCILSISLFLSFGYIYV
jgi:hypothetical protein